MRAAYTISMGREASRYCFMKKNTVGAAMLGRISGIKLFFRPILVMSCKEPRADSPRAQSREEKRQNERSEREKAGEDEACGEKRREDGNGRRQKSGRGEGPQGRGEKEMCIRDSR